MTKVKCTIEEHPKAVSNYYSVSFENLTDLELMALKKALLVHSILSDSYNPINKSAPQNILQAYQTAEINKI